MDQVPPADHMLGALAARPRPLLAPLAQRNSQAPHVMLPACVRAARPLHPGGCASRESVVREARARGEGMPHRAPE
eukprot:CAMPEP_0185163344 /NCGR_PEP_ID=MMETSP1139-20130426/7847_1 /TAXON_ID=298111 /ORGANISM="Pavlova sp., Strain CCMP459" /LENGTH=75 /DNA_ID=CAMNT_0027728695 /DNA_START=72 /DNA_END=299 /DNA_ORIENTATION=+